MIAESKIESINKGVYMIARIVKSAKSIDWIVWTGVVATILSVIFYFLINGFQSKDIPSWVQAVGSINAILASIWIVRQNERRLMRLRVKRLDAIMDSAFAYICCVYKCAQAVHTEKKKDNSPEMQELISFWRKTELEQTKEIILHFVQNHSEEEVEVVPPLRVISEMSKMVIFIEELGNAIKKKNEIRDLNELRELETKTLQLPEKIANSSKQALFFRQFLGSVKIEGAYEAIKIHPVKSEELGLH